MIRGLAALLIAVLLHGTAEAAVERLQKGQVLWQELTVAQTSQMQDLADAVLQALAGNDSQLAVRLLQQQSNAVLSDGAAQQVLLQLRAEQSSPAAVEFIDWASAQPVRVLRRHEETASDWFLPVFDMAASARDVERAWRENEQRATWLLALRADPRRAIEQVGADQDQLQRAAEAVALLDDRHLQAFATALRDEGAEASAALWLALAARQPAVDALLAVIQGGDAQQKLEALQLASALPAEGALQVLSLMEQEEALASAAVMAMVPILLTIDPRHPQLLKRLAAPVSRASTAAALSRLPDAVRMKRLQGLWEAAAGPDHGVRDGLLFALQLEGSAASMQLKSDWIQSLEGAR